MMKRILKYFKNRKALKDLYKTFQIKTIQLGFYDRNHIVNLKRFVEVIYGRISNSGQHTIYGELTPEYVDLLNLCKMIMIAEKVGMDEALIWKLSN